jgi:hypothetical protein
MLADNPLLVADGLEMCPAGLLRRKFLEKIE